MISWQMTFKDETCRLRISILYTCAQHYPHYSEQWRQSELILAALQWDEPAKTMVVHVSAL
jgi:hypothetical protein